VKCRIGVDEQDPEIALDELAGAVFATGADALWVHARKAWLEGLSPKENRDIPPLDYGRVYRLKARFPERFIGINGGIRSVAEARQHLAHIDGVMFGRAAYHEPGMLAGVDELLGEQPAGPAGFAAVIETMAGYAVRHIERGGRLAHVTRHMTGLFHGLPGARRYRQILSTDATRSGAGPEVLRAAFAAVELSPAEEAA
jgi:tRNA-dihydrouridine synthase A